MCRNARNLLILCAFRNQLRVSIKFRNILVLRKQISENPLDEILRVRLRLSANAGFRVAMLRRLMQAIDWPSRLIAGQPFFAVRESIEILTYLGERTDRDLIKALLALNGGTKIAPHGIENIPKSGPVVIGSTHPVGTFDFISHAAALMDHRPDMKVVANREAARFLGADRIIAVDFDRSDKVLTARQTREGMQAHLEASGALLVFGSGKVPDMVNGRLVEPPWRQGVTRMSLAANAPIVPASPDMKNTPYYYAVRKWARILSGNNAYIGREVASLRYVSELLAKFGGRFNVHYGQLQPPGTSAERLKELAEGLVPGLYETPKPESRD